VTTSCFLPFLSSPSESLSASWPNVVGRARFPNDEGGCGFGFAPGFALEEEREKPLIAILGVEDEEGSSFEGDILYVVVGCGVEGLKELNVFDGGSFYYRIAPA